MPRPGDAGSAPEADARAERARLRALLPDGVEVEGAYVTAVRTWGGFSRAIACQKWHLEAVAQRAPLWPPTTLSPPTTTAIPSPTPTLPQRRAQDRAAALFVLATLKGYYINFYPALLHCDADRYIETVRGECSPAYSYHPTLCALPTLPPTHPTLLLPPLTTKSPATLSFPLL